MRKRRLAVSLVVLFMFVFTALAGCGGDSKAVSNPQSTPTIQQPAAAPTTPPPAEPALQSNTPATTSPAPASVQQQPSEPAKAVTATPPAQANKQEVTVYVTKTGAKYHRDGCRYLSKSKIPMSLFSAKRSYGPCSVCDPPQ